MLKSKKQAFAAELTKLTNFWSDFTSLELFFYFRRPDEKRRGWVRSTLLFEGHMTRGEISMYFEWFCQFWILLKINHVWSEKCRQVFGNNCSHWMHNSLCLIFIRWKFEDFNIWFTASLKFWTCLSGPLFLFHKTLLKFIWHDKINKLVFLWLLRGENCVQPWVIDFLTPRFTDL